MIAATFTITIDQNMSRAAFHIVFITIVVGQCQSRNVSAHLNVSSLTCFAASHSNSLRNWEVRKLRHWEIGKLGIENKTKKDGWFAITFKEYNSSHGFLLLYISNETGKVILLTCLPLYPNIMQVICRTWDFESSGLLSCSSLDPWVVVFNTDWISGHE